jgi:hypothetical protein
MKKYMMIYCSKENQPSPEPAVLKALWRDITGFKPVDTNTQFTLYKALHFQMDPENCKNILNCKNVSFALLNGWNVTKTSFDHA